MNLTSRKTALSALTIASLSLLGAVTDAHAEGTFLPTGQIITPTAIPNSQLTYLKPGFTDAPQFIASGGISSLVSPDQKTLLVLTSGYNLTTDSQGNAINDASQEYVFVYDISSHSPVQKQVIQVPNSFAGIVFSPDGKTLYVGGGVDDDLHSYTIQNGAWAESGTPIKLGHSAGLGLGTPPATAGLAVTADGTQVLVTNLYNASLSIVDVASRSVVKELDLRPGKVDPTLSGVPGGEYPYGVAVKGSDTAYVTSLRDRQIVEIQLGSDPHVSNYISTLGSPNKVIVNREQTRLYTTEDFQDLVQVFDISGSAIKLVGSISTKGPQRTPLANLDRYLGTIPTSLVLTPDEKTLLVTNSGINSVGVISLSGKPSTVAQLPTGFYPTAISVSGDGKWVYVVNEENLTGPNPQEQNGAANQYVFQLQKSSVLSFPIPSQPLWQNLTSQVEKNAHISTHSLSQDQTLFQRLRTKIRHVIYIIAENRTYDQMLGDLDRGNGDPTLTQFGQAVTPNFHQIARTFVDLDNFYDPGDVSGNGWAWSVAGREADYTVKTIPENYSGRGFSYDTEGTDSNINVGFPTAALRQEFDNPQTPSDPDLLPGTGDVAAPDGTVGGEQGGGYLWDAAVRAGLTVRDYGCYADATVNGAGPTYYRFPFSQQKIVAVATKQTLINGNYDPYFYDFDNNYPDFYREFEWEREFNQFVAGGNLPSLEFVRLMHDHMGNFNTAIDGVNTPELQQADHDYAVAKLIEAVAHSPYRENTLIIVVEDDSQDGADHVDSHRSTLYMAGPYLKKGAVVSRAYTTINVLRTIEDILGLDHLNLYTAAQEPMSEAFDINHPDWDFTAKPSALLKDTQLPINPGAFADLKPMKPTHTAEYWAERTKGFDFRVADDLKDPVQFDKIIWSGLKGNQPYPTVRSHLDLRHNRPALLKRAGIEVGATDAKHSILASNP
ncbi:MAG: bifunctional YncE family protein/alkaline phosphatase family protein [Verrucomicrobia bacterium]|nr:bifunctional YncE family protein/alkaline phosphatase family protein [Verrucomicrobiota bacterium]